VIVISVTERGASSTGAAPQGASASAASLLLGDLAMETIRPLVAMLTAIFVVTGIFMRAVGALAQSRFARSRRRRVDKPNPRITPAALRRAAIASSTLSTGIVFAVTIAFRARLFTSEPASVLRTVGQAAAILAAYDFGYYFMHRFAFHGWSVGRKIHAFHHSIRTPYVNDSLYTHPVETAAGVLLFLASVALVGPIGLRSFGLAFFVYSALNLWNHSGIDLPAWWMRPLAALVRCHDVHHESMKSGYYSTITPIWDVVFGTARRPTGGVVDGS
jgi:sterol desaturase/sphingolipid hydroxylase (fatty acid hydroxylase superfamily)